MVCRSKFNIGSKIHFNLLQQVYDDIAVARSSIRDCQFITWLPEESVEGSEAREATQFLGAADEHFAGASDENKPLARERE